MKATVMESRNGKSVILTEDGLFREVNGNYAVGWEFDYKVPLRNNRKMTSRIAAAAACLFMMLSMGTYSYQNLMVYATVTLHGTAPIQLELNRQDKVIGVKAVDESSEALAEQLLDNGIRGAYLEDAVAQVEQMMMAQKDGGKKTSLLPQVQSKSSDKAKALTDMLRQEDAGAGQETTTGTESTTAAETTTAAEKTSEVSAQRADDEETTAASSTTQPSSSEDLSGQEETTSPAELTTQADPAELTTQEAPGEMTAQDAEIEMTAQEAAIDMTAQEAPAAEAQETAEAATAPAQDVAE